MQALTFPGLSSPINTALCSCGHLNLPELYCGQLTRVIWLFEDDLDNQVRRVVKVYAPVTPTGRVRKKGTTYVDVLTLKGWDKKQQLWGVSETETLRLGLDRADAAALLENIDHLITSSMQRSGGSNHWYRTVA